MASPLQPDVLSHGTTSGGIRIIHSTLSSIRPFVCQVDSTFEDVPPGGSHCLLVGCLTARQCLELVEEAASEAVAAELLAVEALLAVVVMLLLLDLSVAADATDLLSLGADEFVLCGAEAAGAAPDTGCCAPVLARRTGGKAACNCGVGGKIALGSTNSAGGRRSSAIVGAITAAAGTATLGLGDDEPVAGRRDGIEAYDRVASWLIPGASTGV